ncbi:MAG: substrate-binding domain-containing protein, partial [Atopobiaceae bacterium]
ITNSDGVPANDTELVRLLANRGVDGLFLVVASELDPDPQLAEVLRQLPMPVVMIDRFLKDVACDQVRFDNELGGYLAAQCLLRHGHRRIACMANLRSNTGLDRVAGVRRAMGEAHLKPDPGWVVESDYYIADAYRAAQKIVNAQVTGVVATSDNIALGLLRRLYECGLRVPDDISIVSYDNSAADALFEPALTSIEQNTGQLAQTALDVMAQRVGQQAQDAGALRNASHSDAMRVLLPPRLVQKDSVATL